MAKDSDPLAEAFGTKETGGLFSGLVAEESSFDRSMMWRLGSWGVAAVGAVVIAVFANQAQLGWRRDQVASADLAHQADRLQMLTKESQNEARRLASAIETLNTDRDRLYSRVTVLEQGLDSVTGAIARQTTTPPQASAAKPQDAPALVGPPAPSVAPVASTPAPVSDKPRTEVAKDAPKDSAKEPSGPPTQSAAAASLLSHAPLTTSTPPMLPLVPSKSIMAPPDPAASKLVQPEATEKAAEKKPDPAPAPIEVAAVAAKPPEAAESEAPAIAVQQTRFAIDLGGANSVDGLRALWRGLSKSNPEIAALRPIIMIKEGNTGLGMQLRLGAGPADQRRRSSQALRRPRRKRPPLRDHRVRRPAAVNARRPGKGTREDSGSSSGEELRQDPGLGAASRHRLGARARRQTGQAPPQLFLKTLLEARGARACSCGSAASRTGEAGDGAGVSGIDVVVVLQAISLVDCGRRQ
ncbi:hypothetical protein ACVW1A_006890 [Bradyrhizobium sp. LB1.3]